MNEMSVRHFGKIELREEARSVSSLNHPTTDDRSKLRRLLNSIAT